MILTHRAGSPTRCVRAAMQASRFWCPRIGVTILPGSAREREAMPNLSSRPIDGDAFVRPIALVKKPRRTLSAACESFAQACIAALEQGASARKAKSGRKDKH